MSDQDEKQKPPGSEDLGEIEIENENENENEAGDGNGNPDEGPVQPESSTATWIRRNAPRIVVGLLCGVIGVVVGTTFQTGPDVPPPAHDHAAGVTYTCSMHPQIRADEPGQCPICGMDLIPVDSAGASTDDFPNRVQLSERARALAQINTTPVRRLSEDVGDMRLLGRVSRDETRVRVVTAWTAGRIDKLHVATTGEEVRAGQTIATIYSPEIYAAHRDLLQALRQLRQLSSSLEFARSSAEATVEAARQKLRLLGLSNSEIASMEKADEPWTQVKIRTRFGGTVVDKLVDEGNYVQPGTGIYRLADLSRLWVQLDAYESDLPRLRVGQEVELTTDSLPDTTFTGTIGFIDPVVDPARRTARVRVEVDNEDGKLKPGMFVEAKVAQNTLASSGPAPLVIPVTAVLFSGRRSLVYVEVPEVDRPTYEAREVEVGPRAGDYFPVLTGVAAGERVVTHGAFAIDADLQIKGGASLLARDVSGPDPQRLDVPAGLRAELAPVVERYLDIQVALADDSLQAASDAAEELLKALDQVDPSRHDASAAGEEWPAVRDAFRTHAGRITQVRDIDAAREAFEPATEALKLLLTRFGNPLDDALRVARCPMAFGNRGAQWVQRGESVDNSYFGADMLACGEIQQTIPTGQYLQEDAQ